MATFIKSAQAAAARSSAAAPTSAVENLYRLDTSPTASRGCTRTTNKRVKNLRAVRSACLVSGASMSS
eukprot:CAMPEP_0174892460 /NCGR_PEP_ID=MMETSP0167-20121228/7410_1 /TAXON_ID=38298 /ORGANISM="Rhodella maculata, Strain CCMP736" /LENGTH=67 /DNA_ID=CAMNT_0016130963 /DNA_START=130 /DNA_END=333 /DNA_ORIENTATION=-